MRIEGPRGADSVKKNEKTRKSGGASGDFKTFLDGGAESAPETSAPSMASSIGSLIAAQSVEDPTEGRTKKRMQERAAKVLDALETVHKGLLSGGLSTHEMARVSQAVSDRREKINDPRLIEILDEVDLRAQVELAKMEMAKEKA